MGSPHGPLPGRFHRMVARGAPDECWPWLGSIVGGGYGQIRLGSHAVGTARAHRVAWELENGPVPDGLLVCHTCDNPRCCNPAHLFLGTYADNNRDRSAKGRSVHGDRWYRIHGGRYGGRTGPVKRPSRARPDPVTAAVFWAVMRRDGGCVLAKLESNHECRDKWGEVQPATATRRLTVEHVKDDLRMGVRAPSDIGHLVAMCHAANVGVPSKVQREAIRAYLRSVA